MPPTFGGKSYNSLIVKITLNRSPRVPSNLYHQEAHANWTKFVLQLDRRAAKKWVDETLCMCTANQ